MTKINQKQRIRKFEQRFNKLQKEQQALGSKPTNCLCDNTELRQQISEEEQKILELQQITNQLIKIFNR